MGGRAHDRVRSTARGLDLEAVLAGVLADDLQVAAEDLRCQVDQAAGEALVGPDLLNAQVSRRVPQQRAPRAVAVLDARRDGIDGQQDRPRVNGAGLPSSWSDGLAVSDLARSAEPWTLPTSALQLAASVPLSLQRDGHTLTQARLALGLPPADPLVGRGPGDAHFPGHMRDGAAGAYTIDQQAPAERGQAGITVGHEGLRAVKIRHLHHTRRPSP